MAKHWWARTVVGRTSTSDPLQDHEPPDARFEAEWRPNVKSRLLVIVGLLGVWAVAVEANLIYIQVYSHDAFVTKARKQQMDVVTPEAPRGDLVDRNGHLLASSVQSLDVFARPAAIRDPETPAGFAREVCSALGDCTMDELAQLTAKLSVPATKWKQVTIRPAREMSLNAAIGIQSWMAKRVKAKLPPVVFVEFKNQRYYPKLDLAAHVVGFVDFNGKGAGGAEWRFDKDIRGVPGRVLTQVDGRDEIVTRVESEPVPGLSLELTIDVVLQNMLEQALREGIAKTGASTGTAIILGVQSGEILAMASYPTFNPNNLTGGSGSEDARRNRAVQDLYEPGSTFKIVTASAAINEHVLTPSDLIDTRPGSMTFPGRKPITENDGHNYGVLTFEDVLVKSSNVGAAKAGIQTGATHMLTYVDGFGFGRRVAPDFTGEQSGGVGGLKAGTLDDSSLASVSMGYQVNVTPMQMVAAANVIATGGLWVEPHVVRARVRNGRREEVQRKAARRVVTPETALTVTTIMEGVVQRGTAKGAALDRYQVAGKTGTAKRLVGNAYSSTEHNVSFVGFVPSRQPVFTILVVVDRPRIGSKTGGAVAAPIFKRIAEAALQYAAVPPSINPNPPIIVPTERRIIPVEPRSPSVAPTLTNAGGRPVMPDLRGLTLREAMRIAGALDLQMTADGDGVVVDQAPVPGALIGPSNRGTLQLRRVPVKAGGGDR